MARLRSLKKSGMTGVERVMNRELSVDFGWQAGEITEGFVFHIEDGELYPNYTRCVLFKRVVCLYLFF